MKYWNKIYSYSIKLNNQSRWRQKQRVALAVARIPTSVRKVLHNLHFFAHCSAPRINMQKFAPQWWYKDMHKSFVHSFKCIHTHRSAISMCKQIGVHVSGNTQKIWNTEENHRFLPFSCSRDSRRKKCYFVVGSSWDWFVMPFRHFAQVQFKLSGVTQKLLVKRQGVNFHLKMHFK